MAEVSLDFQEFPRSPIRSQPPASRKLPSTQSPAAPPSKKVFFSETPVSNSYEKYGSENDTFEFSSKEKETYKDELKVSVSESGTKSHNDCHEHEEHGHHHEKKGKEHHEEKSGGTFFAIVLFIIFVVILFAVLGGLWYCKPECVTNECDDGSKEFNVLTAALYAFIVALVFIILIGAAWYCCF